MTIPQNPSTGLAPSAVAELVADTDTPRLLDSASTTATQDIASSTPIVVTGVEIAFAVTDRPVLVEFTVPWFTAGTGTTSLIANILDDADDVVRVAGLSVVQNTVHPLAIRELITTPGNHVRKGALSRGGSGTAVVNAANGLPQVLLTALEL